MAFFLHAGVARATEEAAPAEDGKPAAPKPDFDYLELKPIVVPIITEKGLTQQLSLVITIELPYGTKDDIKLMEPKLADVYISDLYGILGAGGAMMHGNVVDVAALKDRLTRDTTKVLGDKYIQVLLPAVQQSMR